MTSALGQFVSYEEQSDKRKFFGQSVRIKLALSQAALLCIFLKKIQQCCASARDLNDGCTTDSLEKRRKNPRTRQDSNPRPQESYSTGVCSTAVLQPPTRHRQVKIS